MPGKDGDQRYRDHAAKEDCLINRHLGEQQLHQRVVRHKGQHAERHQAGALQIIIETDHAPTVSVFAGKVTQ